MRTVVIPLPGEDFSTALLMLRDWLRRNRCEPAGYRYDRDEDTVIVSVDFVVPAQAKAFARFFGGKSGDQRGRISASHDHLLSDEGRLGSESDHAARPPTVCPIDKANLVSDP